MKLEEMIRELRKHPHKKFEVDGLEHLVVRATKDGFTEFVNDITGYLYNPRLDFKWNEVK